MKHLRGCFSEPCQSFCQKRLHTNPKNWKRDEISEIRKGDLDLGQVLGQEGRTEARRWTSGCERSRRRREWDRRPPWRQLVRWSSWWRAPRRMRRSCPWCPRWRCRHHTTDHLNTNKTEKNMDIRKKKSTHQSVFCNNYGKEGGGGGGRGTDKCKSRQVPSYVNLELYESRLRLGKKGHELSRTRPRRVSPDNSWELAQTQSTFDREARMLSSMCIVIVRSPVF